MKIIPTIFARNKKEFQERFKKLLSVSKNLQIDFMDGKFVKAKSVSFSQIPNLKKYSTNFEAHLMCLHPEKYLSQLKKKGFKKVIFHIEATKEPEKIAQKIKSLHMNPFIAINPETKLEKILPFLPFVKGVLFLGVHPGREHQKFLPKVYNKISRLRSLNKKTQIQVDGGATPAVIKKLAKLKVNILNSGSFVSEAENPKETLARLRRVSSKYVTTV
jgi:ribulose-phosphate 3-epimerase